MTSKPPRRFAVPVFVTAVVTAVVAGAVAFAVIPDVNGVIHGCRNNRTGVLRVIDAPDQHCTSKETPLDWNQTGVQGPTGPTGETGPQGPVGEPGPSDAYVAIPAIVGLTGQVPSPGGEIGRIDLPAGAFVITARTNLLSGFSDFLVTCRLSHDGEYIDTVEVPYLGQVGRPLVLNTAAVTLATPGTVTWHCYSNGLTFQTYGSPRIVAVKVGTLH